MKKKMTLLLAASLITLLSTNFLNANSKVTSSELFFRCKLVVVVDGVKYKAVADTCEEAARGLELMMQ
uniref:hypothetical protein n=1 Tax=Fulvivirga sp. TaxID=1931237 RepID=UPI00404A9DB4